MRWRVLHAEVSQEHRRQGLATLLYDRIETFLGVKLHPSGWLSEDAYQFWQKRDAKARAVAPPAPGFAKPVGRPEDAPQPIGCLASEVDAGCRRWASELTNQSENRRIRSVNPATDLPQFGNAVGNGMVHICEAETFLAITRRMPIWPMC